MRARGDRRRFGFDAVVRVGIARWKGHPKTARAVRALAAVGLGAIGLYLVLSQRGELAGVTAYLGHLRWWWVLPAVVAETASMMSFGGMQKTLLAGGGVRMGWGWATGITLVGNSISNTLPGGPAFASVFAYRRYRFLGADHVLAAWSVLVTFVLAGAALALFSLGGLVVAGSLGANDGVGETALGTLAALLALGLVLQRRGLLAKATMPAVGMYERILHPSPGEAESILVRIAARLVTVRPALGEVAVAFGWALGNWIFDCACLAAAFPAVGAPVPWRALVLAYGAGQLAANVPITPGGLGVVEGSLAIALVVYGGATTSTVAAVLVYRIISFWAFLPLGWGLWGAMALGDRRATRRASR